jgi:hypothetical protein
VRGPVVVAGLPRSGTSWVAKALSFAPGYSYFREPDNADHVRGAERRFRWLYLPAGRDDEGYRRQLERALAGHVRDPDVMVESPGPILGHLPAGVRRRLGTLAPALYATRPGVLVKLVHSNLALEWLTAARPDARIVPVLRHPCGTYGSWARQGWTPEPARLLDDERLVEEHLDPYVDVIRGAAGFWELAGAEWAAVTLVVTGQLARHPEWVVVQHEWLCLDPLAHFRRLYEALGLPWPDEAAEFLTANDRPGDDRMHTLQRSSLDEIDKWKRQLDPADVAACRRIVERFELPWYPDFEPVATTPRWAGVA